MKKIKDNRGETMVELMVAFVLFMLALATLTVLVSVGLKLNRDAADADRAYYSEFSSETGTADKVKISIVGTGVTWEVENISCDVNGDGLFYFG